MTDENTNTEHVNVYDAYSALEIALNGDAALSDASYQKIQGRVDLYEETIILTKFERGEAVSAYEISPEALAVAFSGLPLTSGLLPADCLFYRREDGEESIGIYVPPQRRKMNVKSEGFPDVFDIVLPGLVFAGKGYDYWLWAVAKRPTTEGDDLFHAPLPNVAETGRICWGNTDQPLCSRTTIHAALALFFESVFNLDFANGKSRAHPDNVLRQWQALSGAEAYPVDDLLMKAKVGEVC